MLYAADALCGLYGAAGRDVPGAGRITRDLVRLAVDPNVCADPKSLTNDYGYGPTTCFLSTLLPPAISYLLLTFCLLVVIAVSGNARLGLASKRELEMRR